MGRVVQEQRIALQASYLLVFAVAWCCSCAALPSLRCRLVPHAARLRTQLLIWQALQPWNLLLLFADTQAAALPRRPIPAPSPPQFDKQLNQGLVRSAAARESGLDVEEFEARLQVRGGGWRGAGVP